MYNQNVCWSEDRIVHFPLFQIAKTFKYIKIIGIIHNFRSDAVGIAWRLKNKKARIAHDELLNVMNIYNLTKNTENSKFAALEFNNIWGK